MKKGDRLYTEGEMNELREQKETSDKAAAAMSADVTRFGQALTEAIEIIEDAWGQWAYQRTDADGEVVYSNGGLSTLEWIEEALPRLREALNPSSGQGDA